MNLRWTLHDSFIMTRRNMLRYIRLPENLVSITVQPIMFLLLFTYVLGGAIRVTTPDYITYLLPGILVQTVVFGAFATALGLAQDAQTGLFERFRSLPIARSAVITGRLTADVMANIFVATLMIGVGFLIGFRFGGSPLESIASPGIAILFALPVAGLFAAIGLTARSVESVNVIGFVAIFPITFISSAFVPVESMPGWLQPVADANPFTRAVNASRALALGQDTGGDVTATLIWTVVLLAIAIPLGVRAYNRPR
ncbi:MAG: ABC transporter permease [Dehalococcoidia bacterium]|nr:ABC transporter permease [Dehalococcoidia bacterium]MCB9490764.1 ABC transporter permease [Dehalococcoidia bacterium]